MVIDAKVNQVQFAEWKNAKNIKLSLRGGYAQLDNATVLRHSKMIGLTDSPASVTRKKDLQQPRVALLGSVTSRFTHDWKETKSEVTRPKEDEGTAAWVEYFDSNWKKENLSKDWFKLKTQSSKKVGFILDAQMDLLKDPYNKEELADWTKKTKRDLEGFKLEFLSDNVVFPRKYFWNKEDNTLEDPLYGKSKDGSKYARITEIVSDQERNGSVRQSLEKIQEFFTTAPDGSIAVMTSPLGPTGFKTADGLAIDYPDSYFFVMVNTPDGVMNYTIKTDFKLHHCREVIFHLTGILLPEEAPLEEYGQTLALIQPGHNESVKNISDVVSVLEKVQGSHAFIDAQNDKVTSWEDVHKQIAMGEDLYQFDVETTAILNEFEQFGKEGIHAKNELLKGIAATILRLGEHFFRKEPSGGKEVTLREKVWQKVKGVAKKSFGDVLEETAERRGCSGGGSGTSGGSIFMQAINGLRRAVAGGGQDYSGENADKDPNLCRCSDGSGPHFHCPGKGEPCGHAIVVKKSISSCPKCGAGEKC
jgi:hypothetical protein